MADKQRVADILSPIWQQQWSALEEQVEGAAQGNKSEYLHRLRVALRQTRALLKVFQRDLPSAEARRFVVELKWLAEATGPVRDLDVHLAQLHNWARAQGVVAEAALTPVLVQLTAERTLAQHHLQRVLTGRRYRQLAQQWRSFGVALPATGVGAAPARVVVALKLAKQSLKLLRGGLAIKPTTAPKTLHRLRIRAKRLRYLLESFAPLFARHKSYRPFLRALKQLQQLLGDYRDSEVAGARIAALAGSAKSWPQALPWLAAWQDELQRRQQRASAAFAAALAAFDASCGQLPA